MASFIGTTVEFYDFLIYGTAAALVFPKLFFPNVSPASVLSFATFGVGFVARRLGGIVFGHFGDRVSRKRMLVYSQLIMGGATVLMGAPSNSIVAYLIAVSVISAVSACFLPGSPKELP